MKEFITAVQAEVEDAKKDPGVEFSIDGTELVAYKPKDGQVALLMARIGRHSSTNDKMAGIIDFFAGVLDSEGHQYVVNRLLDREDDFGFENVTEVLEFLLEEWGGRPTK